MSVPSSGHPHDELAVLALDAMEPDEREVVEAHVRGCAACRAELDDYRQTLAVVAVEGAELPPASAWARISEQVTAPSNGQGRRPLGDPPARGGGSGPAAPLASLPGPPAGGRVTGAPGGPPAPSPRRAPGGAHDLIGGPVIELHGTVPRHRRRAAGTRRPVLLAAAAAVVVVVGLAVALRPSGPDPDGDVVVAVRALLGDPDAAVADLVGPHGRPVGQVVVAGDEGYALVESLSPLPEGREYQLWSLDGDEATSLGMLGDGSGTAVAVRPVAPNASAHLAISEEPEGGNSSPTGAIVATGTFT
jgi:anti-sigma-K factor RskA